MFQAAKRFDESAMPVIHRMTLDNGFPPCSGVPSTHPAGVLSFVGTIVDCIQIEVVRDRAARRISSVYEYEPPYERKDADALIPDDPADDGMHECAFGLSEDAIEWRRQDGWSFGPWCAVIIYIRPLPPIPWRGSQGWFDVPDTIVAEALRAA